MRADVSSLVGRNFVSLSGNHCSVQRIESGALRMNWRNKPTAQDMEEAERFVEGVLGDIEITRCANPRDEQAELSKWRQATR
jgi:hypothetical protein